jgi:acyl-lipid omega-6 desaturase (Delta-12 desaturase)
MGPALVSVHAAPGRLQCLAAALHLRRALSTAVRYAKGVEGRTARGARNEPGLAALIAALGQLVGFERAMLVQLPIVVVASIVGVWLFTLQHRFERSLWARHGEWTFATAAVAGSSYLRLPPILRWFTGNIGFHHAHHLNPRVPNYRLGECHDSIAGLANVPILTLRTALRAPLFALWDEDRRTMVTFRAASRVA